MRSAPSRSASRRRVPNRSLTTISSMPSVRCRCPRFARRRAARKPPNSPPSNSSAETAQRFRSPAPVTPAPFLWPGSAQRFLDQCLGSRLGPECHPCLAHRPVSIHGLVAQCGQRENGVVHATVGRCDRRGRIGGGHAAQFRRTQFVTQLDHQPLRGFATDARALRKQAHVPRGDRRFERRERKFAHDAERHLRAHAGDFLDQEAKEVALRLGGEAVERGRILAIDCQRVELRGLAGGRKAFGRGDWNVDLVAQTAGFNYRGERRGGGENPRDARDHFKPSTSCMSYTPGGCFTTQCAARTAPRAKMPRSLALCVSSRRSPRAAKRTVWSPTTSPPRKACTPTSVGARSPVMPERPCFSAFAVSLRSSRMISIKRAAVPLGASFLKRWCISMTSAS